MTRPAGPRVLDTSTGIAGAYAALLLTEAGADVVRVEPAGGDPLRRWRHGDVETDDGALFEYLRQGQVAVRLEQASLDGPALVATGADLVLATPTGDQGSHRLTSMLGAGALAMVPPGQGELGAGERVELELL